MNCHRANPGSTIDCSVVLLHEAVSIVVSYMDTYMIVSVPTCQARKPGAAASTRTQTQSMPHCIADVLRGPSSVVPTAARSSWRRIVATTVAR